MININLIYIIILLSLSKSVSFSQNIVINEVVSDNNLIIQDVDGDYSDWVEIYNNENYDIDLIGYFLSDNENSLQKWTFPNVIITANSYMLIFASAKDKIQSGELHSNFKISQSGEPIILSDNNNNVLSKVASKFIPADFSYALDVSSELMYLTETITPNALNIINNGINCSHQSGFYNDNIELELTGVNANEQIYYTLNGETPTVNSNIYSVPIHLVNVSDSPFSISAIPTTPMDNTYKLKNFVWQEPQSVYKCNVVRYAAFENGVIQGEVFSKSYFIDSEINNRYAFPIISLITDNDNLFDYENGIYIPGKRFDEEGWNGWPQGNYLNKGNDWEKLVNLTFLKNNGLMTFETNAGMRMLGYGSASNPQKSFKIYFRNEYGINKINHKIFDNSEVKKYKRLIFRNGGNDFLYTHYKDALLHEVIRPMDLEIQEFKPSIMFINGEYWGIHNIRERYDKFYFKYKYGIDSDSINILGVCGAIEEGSNDDYIELINFINSNDISLESNYNYIKSKIDILNFIDFQIAEIYFANYDWPCNNYKMWKDKSPNSKWRFLIYDLDASLSHDNHSLSNTKSLKHASSNESGWPYCKCSNLIFRELLTNENFNTLFISKFVFHLTNTFSVERMTNIINDFELLYNPEIEEHITRWNYPESVNDWSENNDKLREFVKERPCYMSSDIISFFNLKQFDFDCTAVGSEELADFLLFPNPNNGAFFMYNNTGKVVKGAEVFISDLTGRIVYKLNDVNILTNNNLLIDNIDFSSGIYIVTIKYDEEILSQKVMINK